MRRGAPTIVLIHGGSAHSGWWTATAGQLASKYDVVLPDLSGHGDSGHREEYQPDIWAEEMAQVIGDCGNELAFIVGHSIGGLVGVHLAALAPGAVAGLVLVDTRLKSPTCTRIELSSGPTGNGNVGSIRRGKRVCRASVWFPVTPLQILRRSRGWPRRDYGRWQRGGRGSPIRKRCAGSRTRLSTIVSPTWCVRLDTYTGSEASWRGSFRAVPGADPRSICSDTGRRRFISSRSAGRTDRVRDRHR